MIIHADEPGEEKRVESFVVGQDVEKGERLQWIVDGGKFKGSFLLEDGDEKGKSEGLLISETVNPVSSSSFIFNCWGFGLVLG